MSEGFPRPFWRGFLIGSICYSFGKNALSNSIKFNEKEKNIRGKKHKQTALSNDTGKDYGD